MSGERRTVVLTGANAGIGRAAAERIAGEGHRVVAVVRDRTRGERAMEEIRFATGNQDVILAVADMADQTSIEALALFLHDRFSRLDALVNNAAVFDQTATRELTGDGHERFWATNHLGPFLLTARLADLLLRSDDGRVVTIASKGLMTTPRIRIRTEAIDGEGWFTPTRAYYHSKLAQVMFAATLARRFTAQELYSVALRVPAVRLDADRLAAMPTRLRLAYAPKNRFAATPTEMATVYARLAVGSRVALSNTHGAYVDEQLRPVAPPRSARDETEQDRLWEQSLRQTGQPSWPTTA